MNVKMTWLCKECRHSSALLLFGVLSCASVKPANRIENPIEQQFIVAGLVDVQRIDPSIHVDLVNSDSGDNFFGEDFYHGLEKAYLQRSVAQKLSQAQQILRRKQPTYSLLVMDAARPFSVSVAMWEEMKGTRLEKFVANPKRGSMHNYGAAVDLTIVDDEGDLLDMGFMPFYKSKFGVACSYLFSGKDDLSKDQRSNRALLKQVMLSAGFRPLAHEWWHFSGYAQDEIGRRFEMIK